MRSTVYYVSDMTSPTQSSFSKLFVVRVAIAKLQGGGGGGGGGVLEHPEHSSGSLLHYCIMYVFLCAKKSLGFGMASSYSMKIVFIQNASFWFVYCQLNQVFTLPWCKHSHNESGTSGNIIIIWTHFTATLNYLLRIAQSGDVSQSTVGSWKDIRLDLLFLNEHLLAMLATALV